MLIIWDSLRLFGQSVLWRVGSWDRTVLNFILLLVAKLQSRGMRHHVVWLIGTRAGPEDQGSVFPQNVGSHLLQDYMALQPEHNVGTYCYENLKY